MEGITGFMGNVGIYVAIALLAIAIISALIGPIVSVFTNFEESKKALVGVLGVGVVLLIGFALSSSELTQHAIDEGISAQQFKMIGAVINTALIAIAIMVVYLVVDLVISVVRN